MTLPVRAVVGVTFRRLFRDPGTWFFVFVFPFLMILLIGSQFGGEPASPRMAVAASDPLAEQLADRLGEIDGIEVVSVPAGRVEEAVRSGDVAAGLVIPAGYGDALRSGQMAVSLEFITRPDGSGVLPQMLVFPTLAEENQRIVIGDFLRSVERLDLGAALARADAALGLAPTLEVARTTPGEGAASPFSGLGRFDLGAMQQLLLFVFLTALASAIGVVESREMHVTERMLASPVTPAGVLVGMGLARFAVAVFQGLLIMGGTWLMFGVGWGNPIASLAILAVFAAVATGAAMLLGALGRTEHQVTAASVGVGLIAAALGGSMLPLDLMPDQMQTVAHITPHAWAYEAYAAVIRDGEGVVAVLPQLGVLATMAIVLLLIGGRVLRKHLV